MTVVSTYAGFISRRALKLNIFKLPALSRNTWLELGTSHRAAADSGFDGNVSFGKKNRNGGCIVHKVVIIRLQSKSKKCHICNVLYYCSYIEVKGMKSLKCTFWKCIYKVLKGSHCALKPRLFSFFLFILPSVFWWWWYFVNKRRPEVIINVLLIK